MRLTIASLLLLSLAVDLLAGGQVHRVYDEARQVGAVDLAALRESSGLAASRRDPNVLWTHNDSGGGTRLYAIDRRGKLLAIAIVKGARGQDWEDMASFVRDGNAYLLVGDFGDNNRRRTNCCLYLLREPDLSSHTPKSGKPLQLQVEVSIPFIYTDGRHDCESLAVDPNGKMAYLATKETPLTAQFYQLGLPARSVPKDKPLIARPIAQLPILKATGMDMSPDGNHAVVCNYGAAFEYTRRKGQTWPEAFSARPVPVAIPRLKQGEAICYSLDGKAVFLTSEGVPCPLWRLALRPYPAPESGRVDEGP